MSLITRNVVSISYKISKSSINLPEVAKFGRIQVHLPWRTYASCVVEQNTLIPLKISRQKICGALIIK